MPFFVSGSFDTCLACPRCNRRRCRIGQPSSSLEAVKSLGAVVYWSRSSLIPSPRFRVLVAQDAGEAAHLGNADALDHAGAAAGREREVELSGVNGRGGFAQGLVPFAAEPGAETFRETRRMGEFCAERDITELVRAWWTNSISRYTLPGL
jgi:hypothetical protein